MKKLVSLLIVLCMALAMIPAMADETLAGDWYLVELLFGEESMNPAMLGMNMVMTLDEDGTGIMVSVSEDEDEPDTEPVTWKATETGLRMTITDDDETETMEFVLEDGLLKSEMEGLGMVFSREAPEDVVLPEAIVAESEDEFVGEWMINSMVIDGTMIPASLFGLEITVIIEPGMATIISTEEDDEDETLLTTFEDGVLFGVEPDEDDIDEDDVTVFELNDNGWLSITQVLDEEEDSAMIMYFELVVEEEAE